MEKTDIVKHILRHTSHNEFANSAGGSAWAPSNVALCKYWGKRDNELNLPVTASLSISLGNKGAFTQIKQEPNKNHNNIDNYFINDTLVAPNSKFSIRLKKFLDLFRPHNTHYIVTTDTNVPIAAGFASSACGFASLVQALNNLYDWRLTKQDLSILARLGSGSACRSLFNGFVEWQRGEKNDGMDSYSIQLEHIWPELRLGAYLISAVEKTIPSREAMQHTQNTSPLYIDWPETVEQDLADIKLALARKDFTLLGYTAENNALKMHAMMHTANPPIIYSLPETLTTITKIQELRSTGIPVFFTQDAGANLQLLFLAAHEQIILQNFPQLEIIMPFAMNKTNQVIVVNHNDIPIGESEKLAAHTHGKLHRAFSVVILRQGESGLEILLQQRSAIKYHSANLWSNACCGHPHPGEETIAAATRRLHEELGITIELQEIGKFHYMAQLSNSLIENEIDHVLLGFSDVAASAIKFNDQEVQQCQWITIKALQIDLRENPDKYTVWLPLVLNAIQTIEY